MFAIFLTFRVIKELMGKGHEPAALLKLPDTLETHISMLKTFSALGLVIGLLMVIALITSSSETGKVEAQVNLPSGSGCMIHEIPLDEGYGVTRKSVTMDCEKN